MSSRLGTLSIQLYRGARQLATRAACRPHVLFAPTMTRLPFSTYVYHDEKKRDDELLWKTYRDSFDESDWIEKGKDAKQNRNVVSFSMSTEELSQKSFSDAFDESDAIEKGKLARMALIAERVESITEKESPSFIMDMSREELSQKSFSDAFDESDAIEMGKRARMALIAERVESCNY